MAGNIVIARNAVRHSKLLASLLQQTERIPYPSSQIISSKLFDNALLSTTSYQSTSSLTLRFYSSTPQKSNSFFGKIIENIREESRKNKELKKGIEGFTRDIEELSKSEIATKAREKFDKIEQETLDGSRKARHEFEKLKQKVSEADVIQKASKLTEGAKETVQKVGHNISQKGEDLSKTQAYKAVSSTARIVKEEIDSSALSGAGMRVYRPPTVLRRRTERNEEAEERVMQANTHATGVVLHKDSRFSQSWQDFKDNNPYVNRVMEWKTKLDESDNVVVRASFVIKDKVQELFGPVFHRTDLSETLTEICKMDPDFNKDIFLLQAEYDIIPNILEAMVRPDLEILKDWSYERAYSVTAAEVKQNETLGHRKIAKVLDIDNVDLAMGKVLDEGPVLAVTFQAQVIEYIKNMKGDIVEGDPEQVSRRHYVWVFCRDQTQLDPRAAWKLLEYTYHSANQLV